MRRLLSLSLNVAVFVVVMSLSLACEKDVVPSDKLVENTDSPKNNGARKVAALHAFIKINDRPYENGQTLFVYQGTRFKIQVWFWSLDADGNRFEFEYPGVPLFQPPSGLTLSNEYYRSYPPGPGRYILREKTGARDYTVTDPYVSGDFKIITTYTPYAYVTIRTNAFM